MQRRRRALLAMPVFGLEPRRQAHPAPFLLIQLAVGVAVETLQQTGEITLPLANHLALGGGQIQPVPTATTGAEIADGVKRLAFVQPLFGIAVAFATAEQAQPAARRNATRVAQIAGPDPAKGWMDVRAARIDQAFAGGVGQTQPGFTGAALHHVPAAALAIGAVLLDTVTPPQTRLAGQRRHRRWHRQLAQHADQLDIALGR